MPKKRKSTAGRKSNKSGIEQFFNQIGKGRGISKGKKKNKETDQLIDGM